MLFNANVPVGDDTISAHKPSPFSFPLKAKVLKMALAHS